MKLDSLRKLYVHELKDLWSAENQILKALPAAIDAADDDDLRSALRSHHEETRGQVGRLETVFEEMDFSPRGHHCAGMEGLLKELDGALDSEPEKDVRDAMIISALQRVEHYEMAGYGVARAFARKLGESAAADLLQETLEEEGRADRRLTELAEQRINFMAMAT